MPLSIKKVGNLVPNYKSGLEIAADAYSAVNKENIVTSSEDFNFNPVGVYDTVKGEWVEIDVDNPDTWEGVLEGDPSEWKDRYSVAFGTDMDNIDGFMNIEDLTGNMETETSDINGDPNANGPIAQYTDTDTDGSVSLETDTEIQEPGTDGAGEFTVKDNLKSIVIEDFVDGLTTNKDYDISFDGHDAKLRYYWDGKTTIYYRDGGTEYWYTYDSKNDSGNRPLIDVQKRVDGVEQHYNSKGELTEEVVRVPTQIPPISNYPPN